MPDQSGVLTYHTHRSLLALHHTCGLRADGSIICWGASGEAERLTETTGLIDSPSGSFSQISAGYLHSCALRLDGTVEVLGRDAYGG